jgi:hypothetical protein
VLYHLTDPVELIRLLCAQCRAVFIWTVVYDATFLRSHPDQAKKFGEASTRDVGGFRHTVHTYDYGASLDWAGFCGGPKTYSYWMQKEEIVAAFRHFGFHDVRWQEQDNIHSPALLLAATRGR